MTFCRKEPDLELEGLLKRHSTTVKFFQGSMMNAVDLARVKVVALRNISRTVTCLLPTFIFLFLTNTHTWILTDVIFYYSFPFSCGGYVSARYFRLSVL